MFSRLASNEVGRIGGLILALGIGVYNVNGNRVTIKQKTGLDIPLFDHDVIFYIALACVTVGGLLVTLG
jgi:hypothetical protein